MSVEHCEFSVRNGKVKSCLWEKMVLVFFDNQDQEKKSLKTNIALLRTELKYTIIFTLIGQIGSAIWLVAQKNNGEIQKYHLLLILPLKVCQ